MINDLFIYAPSLISIGAIVLLLLQPKIILRDGWLLFFLALLAVHFTVDAWFFSTESSTLRKSVFIDVVSRSALLSLLPTIVFWFKKKVTHENAAWFCYLLYLIPAVWIVVMITLFHTFGESAQLDYGTFFVRNEIKDLMLVSRSGKALFYMRMYGFPTLMCIETVVFLTYFIAYFARLMRLRPLKPNKKFQLMLVCLFLVISVVVCVRVCLGYFYLLTHPRLNTLFYVTFMVCIVLTLYWNTCDEMLRRHHRLKMNGALEEKSESADMDQIRFEKLMILQAWCYKKGVTVDAVAKELGTNRTYLSNMIKVCYGTSFSAWVTERRIRYAKQLMLDNPDVKLVEIAEKSGFADDSSFSRSFSKLVGKTPREWYVTHQTQ